MAIMVIDSADEMREHAARWESSAQNVGGYVRDNFLVCAETCRKVAESIESGALRPGTYQYRGTATDFFGSLLAGKLSPDVTATV